MTGASEERTPPTDAPLPEGHDRDRPPEPEGFPTRPLVLFLATVTTTFWFGAYGFDVPFFPGEAWAWSTFWRGWELGPGMRVFLASPSTLLGGWVYSVPLLVILVCHEMGHFVTARLHGVRQSLPYFIPFPLGFGTMGAVIRLDDRIPDRNVLLDIGVMGPIMGMVVAVPIMILGLLLSPVIPDTGSAILEGSSLLYMLLKLAVHGNIPDGFDVSLHPVALSAWLGFYLTMLNLFPIGQLDGGHVVHALTPRSAPKVSALFLALLFLNGLALTAFGGPENGVMGYGFMIMAALVFLFASFHPPVSEPSRPLTLRRKILGAVAMFLFLATYVPVPWTAVL